MPAVSIIFIGMSLIVKFTSITSLVVPGILVTIAFSFFASKFNKELLPTFVLPISAMDIPLCIYEFLFEFSISNSIFSLTFLMFFRYLV